MPVLEWDKVGERTFQAGVDRGVLYVGNEAVPWNGLTNVEETFNREGKPYYLDGIKYLDFQVLGEFSGKLTAFTYPEEFEGVDGVTTTGQGLFIHDQAPKSFGLSYRTKIGNDVDGLDHGYRIHLLYNLRAVPDTHSYSSVDKDISPMSFSWALSSTPEFLDDHRPTAHISIKSTDVEPIALTTLEEMLYGSSLSAPYLPSIGEVYDLIGNPVIIVDNGDGTWTAFGSDRAVELLNETTFQINGVDATYLDDDTYTITTTTEA